MLENYNMLNGVPRRAKTALSLVITSLLLFSSLLVASCSKPPKPEQRYDLKGTVVAVDRTRGKVDIAHEEIEGYMAAMTMPFTIKDKDILNSMSNGDYVQATLVVTDDAYWLENPVISKSIPGGASHPTGGSEPKVGEEVPRVALLNQHGKPLKFGPADPRATVVTFIYTRCPFADQCPLMSTNFAALHDELGKDERLKTRVRLVSVTLDPAYDTPEVMREYGVRYTAGREDDRFARWEFATGDAEEIGRLATFLGLMYKEDDGQVIHSLRTAVLTPDGKLYKLYRGNEWKPDEILRDLRELSTQEQPEAL